MRPESASVRNAEDRASPARSTDKEPARIDCLPGTRCIERDVLHAGTNVCARNVCRLHRGYYMSPSRVERNLCLDSPLSLIFSKPFRSLGEVRVPVRRDPFPW